MSEPLNEKAPAGGEGEERELTSQSSATPEFLSTKPHGWTDQDWLVCDVMLRGGIFIRHITDRLTPLVIKAQRSGRLIELSRSSLLRDGKLADVRYDCFCGRFNRQPKLNKALRRQLHSARGSIAIVHCGLQMEYASEIIRHAISAGVIGHDLLPTMRADFRLQQARFEEAK